MLNEQNQSLSQLRARALADMQRARPRTTQNINQAPTFNNRHIVDYTNTQSHSHSHPQPTNSTYRPPKPTSAAVSTSIIPIPKTEPNSFSLYSPQEESSPTNPPISTSNQDIPDLMETIATNNSSSTANTQPQSSMSGIDNLRQDRKQTYLAILERLRPSIHELKVEHSKLINPDGPIPTLDSMPDAIPATQNNPVTSSNPAPVPPINFVPVSISAPIQQNNPLPESIPTLISQAREIVVENINPIQFENLNNINGVTPNQIQQLESYYTQKLMDLGLKLVHFKKLRLSTSYFNENPVISLLNKGNQNGTDSNQSQGQSSKRNN